MTTVDGEVRQEVTAEGGYAYGVIGADLHVVHGRGPVYLLANHTPARSPSDSGPPAQPSYLLDARSAVVDFVGRQAEVRDLTAWRDSDQRLAVRWLHGPGGQGKTRLAAHLADDSMRGGWKVIVAEHTAGKVDARHPASQDLRLCGATGLLLVVDYADRWPLAHLTWLFSNKVLNQDAPVRVLLLARTAHVWPALRHALTQAGWPPDSCATQRLGPLTGSRGRMFTTARDSFARCYGLSNPHVIGVPDGLDRDEFGLTLAVHMAALVAVDRHAHTATQPPLEDTTGLTAYLLDRDRHHWHTLHETGATRDGGRVAFDTTPDEMSRAVFTAALTGPLGYRDARKALEIVGAGTDRVLADHTFCYPPADPRTVLEPLYPDRLAEDFLALCLASGAWADGTPELLLTDGDALPPYAPRAITFLAAASDRWPHLTPLLEALEPLLPDDPQGALAIAAADLAERLANHRLATTIDPAERAEIHLNLADRLHAGHRNDEAKSAYREAVRLYRSVAETDPFLAYSLALALTRSASFVITTTAHGGDWLTNNINLANRGYRWIPPERGDEIMTALGEAREILSRLVRDLPAHYAENYVGEEDITHLLESMTTSVQGGVDVVSKLQAEAMMLMERWPEALPQISAKLTDLRAQAQDTQLLTGLDQNVFVLLNLDRPEEALPVAEEAVQLARRLTNHEAALRTALHSYAHVLHKLKRHGESLRAMREVVGIARRLARGNPAEHANTLRSALEALVQLLSDQHKWEEALPPAEEAVEIARRLAQDDPGKHEGSLAGNLSHLANALLELHRQEEGVPVMDEATVIRRRLAQDNPALHEHMLAGQLAQLSHALGEMRRWREALIAGADSVEIFSRVEHHVQVGVETHLSSAINGIAGSQWRRQRPAEELRAEFDGDLAGLVEILRTEFASPGRGNDAFPGFAEAIEEFRRDFAHHNPAGPLYRQLTGADPLAAEAHLAEAGPAGLAAMRGAQAMTLRSLGRHEEALPAACESASIYIGLSRTDPLTYLPLRVEALVRTAVLLGELGATEPDSIVMKWAIDSRRQLARDDPATHEPALAVELAIMARALAKQGRWAEAVASATESFDIRRSLGETVDDSLTAAEEFLTTHLAEVELRPEYRAALRDAVADSSRIRRSGG